MITAKSDFEKRKDEINEYFDFVEIIYSEEKDVNIKYKKRTSHVRRQQYIVSDKLQKVLIANGFLLLYNLVEATTRNSLCEIFNELVDKEIDYKRLTEKLKRIFLKQNTLNLKEGTFSIVKLNNQLFDLTMSVINEEVVSFSKERIDFSGNLDAKKIREIAEEFGFALPISKGDNLLTIKTKRNHLAHGDYSFSEIGRDFSIGDLLSFKKETFMYLEEVISNIEVFLNDNSYLSVIH